MGWEVASMQVLGDYLVVVLKNMALENVHMNIN